MAKIQHLYSATPGNVPGSLVRGQVAINIPDKIVYANDPFGNVAPISNGNAGVANASSLLGGHIPTQFHPVAQFGVGMTESQLTSGFTDDGTTATMQPTRVFVMGKAYYTPVLTCASSSIGFYVLALNVQTRTVQLLPKGTVDIGSGASTFRYDTGDVRMVIKSDGHIYPWFYLPVAYSAAGQTVSAFRISPYQTFGAIPVSTGFPGANAASYWGTFP